MLLEHKSFVNAVTLFGVLLIVVHMQARRALRALKGLVKLQALVRGRIVRNQSADMLRRMQAMARAQARACASRASLSASPHSSTRSSNSHTPHVSFQYPLCLFVLSENISAVNTWNCMSTCFLKG